jgi:DNA polymerase elongation subunit (family B)
VLHGIVDCLWVRKPGASQEEVEDLCKAIEEITGLPIAIEGHYHWIQFLPSLQDSEKPVPNRFFGLFEDGTFKYRGIELRKRDQPRLVKRVQEELIHMLEGAHNLEAYRSRAPDLIERVAEAAQTLQSGEVSVHDLLVIRQISKKPEDYEKNCLLALAAKQAQRAGFNLEPGQAVAYVICDTLHPDPSQRVCIAPLLQPETPYDLDKYLELLCRAAATVLFPLGLKAEDVRAALGPAGRTKRWPPPQKKRRTKNKKRREVMQTTLF